MIGLVEAKERPCRPRARRHRQDLGLDHRARDLVLEPLARQLGPGIDLARVPVGRPQQLHRVRGETGGSLEAAVRDPRMPAALRQILAAHHHGSAARMAGDVVVDVLRRVGLVVHDEATVTEAHVLHENRIARDGLRAGVRHVHPPQPEPLPRVQPKRDAVPQAAAGPLPGEAVGAGAEAGRRAGPDQLRERRLGRADAQVKAANSAVERGALHLVDQRSTVLVLVLDREDATIGQNAERQAGGVRDATQAKIAVAGRLQDADGAGRHPLISRLQLWRGPPTPIADTLTLKSAPTPSRPGLAPRLPIRPEIASTSAAEDRARPVGEVQKERRLRQHRRHRSCDNRKPAPGARSPINSVRPTPRYERRLQRISLSITVPYAT